MFYSKLLMETYQLWFHPMPLHKQQHAATVGYHWAESLLDDNGEVYFAVQAGESSTLHFLQSGDDGFRPLKFCLLHLWDCTLCQGPAWQVQVPGRTAADCSWRLWLRWRVFEHKASLSGTLPRLRSPFCRVVKYAQLSWMMDWMKLGWPVTSGALGCAAGHRLWCPTAVCKVPT